MAIGIGGTALGVGLLVLRSNDHAGVVQAEGTESAAAAPVGFHDIAPRPVPPVLDQREPIAPDPAGERTGAVASNTAVISSFEPKKPEAKLPTDPRDLPETTLDELRKKRDAIRKELDEKSRPILSQRFDDNLAQHISNEQSYSTTDTDTKAIYAVKMIPGEGTWRTELPRVGYEDLYTLKDETIRLDSAIGGMEFQESMNKSLVEEALRNR